MLRLDHQLLSLHRVKRFIILTHPFVISLGFGRFALWFCSYELITMTIQIQTWHVTTTQTSYLWIIPHILIAAFSEHAFWTDSHRWHNIRTFLNHTSSGWLFEFSVFDFMRTKLHRWWGHAVRCGFHGTSWLCVIHVRLVSTWIKDFIRHKTGRCVTCVFVVIRTLLLLDSWPSPIGINIHCSWSLWGLAQPVLDVCSAHWTSWLVNCHKVTRSIVIICKPMHSGCVFRRVWMDWHMRSFLHTSAMWRHQIMLQNSSNIWHESNLPQLSSVR